MVKLKNTDSESFKEYIKNKKVIIFGAGKALETPLYTYFENKDIDQVVDNDRSKWGSHFNHNGNEVYISGPDYFKEHKGWNNTIIFVTSTFYAAEIVEQLDSIKEIDGVECFLAIVVRDTIGKKVPFEFTRGKQRIPKKIHYIWLGGKPLPDEFKENIQSWRKYNPDYEIIRWDESNYDFSKSDYVREAYESKEWGFASNYMRLDIVFNHGGIYLDTDVIVKKPFDCLLNDRAFFNMGTCVSTNMGCGFGSAAHVSIIKEMMNSFAEDHFLDQFGKPNRKACHTYIDPVLIRHGFKIKNEYQNKDCIALYPREVMSPKTIYDLPDDYTEHTVSVHTESGTWQNSHEISEKNKLTNLLKARLS